MTRYSSFGRRLTAAVCLTATVLGGVVGCSATSIRSTVGFALDAPIVDYNPTTIAGATGASRAAFSRVLLGFSYLDGLGNRVADTEFGAISVKKAGTPVVHMAINSSAVFSDGHPVTCDDILLSWIARRPRPGNPFRTLGMPGLTEIAEIRCAPESKTADVVFRSKELPRDWLALFGAGTILPWHVVSQSTGVTDLRRILAGKDPGGLEKIARFWSTQWRIDNQKGAIDEKLFLASGPYKVESVDKAGAITLVRNPQWWGESAKIERIVVHSQHDDVVNALRKEEIHVGDVAEDTDHIDIPTGYSTARVSSQNVIQLRLSTRGIMTRDVRRAFLSCIPREEIETSLFPANKKKKAAGTPEELGRRASAVLPLGNSPVTQQIIERVRQDRQASSITFKKPITVTVGYPAHSTNAPTIIKYLAQACASRGLTIHGSPLNDFTGEALAQGNIHAAIVGTAGAAGPGGADDPASGLLGMLPTVLPDFSPGDARGLFTRVIRMTMAFGENDAIQENGIDKTADFVNIIVQLQNYLLDEGYAVPLYVQPRRQFVHSRLQGVTQGRSSASIGWNMDRWTV